MQIVTKLIYCTKPFQTFHCFVEPDILSQIKDLMIDNCDKSKDNVEQTKTAGDERESRKRTRNGRHKAKMTHTKKHTKPTPTGRHL